MISKLIQQQKFLLISCLLLLTSCGGNSCHFEFSDFSNNPMFECTPIDGAGTFAFSIRVRGAVSDPVELYVYHQILGVQPQLKYALSGKIDTLIINDWGRGKLIGVIKASPVTNGKLEVTCNF